MPYVNIKITDEGASSSQKAALISGVTDVLVGVLGKDPATTFVVIDVVETEHWGIGGLPVEEYRRGGRAPVQRRAPGRGDDEQASFHRPDPHEENHEEASGPRAVELR